MQSLGLTVFQIRLKFWLKLTELWLKLN